MEKLTIEDKKFIRNSGLGLISAISCITYHSNFPFDIYNIEIIGQYRISDIMGLTITAALFNYYGKIYKNELKKYFSERKQNKAAKKKYEQFGDTLEDITFI
ncbi:MAG: hypothetical protein PHN56_05090 [Candidatus Nanoarchaeia archaeon]|nr:hypothetical protein [Candidatus Nanoarchaeia archaeon]